MESSECVEAERKALLDALYKYAENMNNYTLRLLLAFVKELSST